MFFFSFCDFFTNRYHCTKEFVPIDLCSVFVQYCFCFVNCVTCWFLLFRKSLHSCFVDNLLLCILTCSYFYLIMLVSFQNLLIDCFWFFRCGYVFVFLAILILFGIAITFAIHFWLFSYLLAFFLFLLFAILFCICATTVTLNMIGLFVFCCCSQWR